MPGADSDKGVQGTHGHSRPLGTGFGADTDSRKTGKKKKMRGDRVCSNNSISLSGFPCMQGRGPWQEHLEWNEGSHTRTHTHTHTRALILQHYQLLVGELGLSCEGSLHVEQVPDELVPDMPSSHMGRQGGAQHLEALHEEQYPAQDSWALSSCSAWTERKALHEEQHPAPTELSNRNRQDKRVHLFQPAWLVRRLIHRLDQMLAPISHQLLNTMLAPIPV